MYSSYLYIFSHIDRHPLGYKQILHNFYPYANIRDLGLDINFSHPRCEATAKQIRSLPGGSDPQVGKHQAVPILVPGPLKLSNHLLGGYFYH